MCIADLICFSFFLYLIILFLKIVSLFFLFILGFCWSVSVIQHFRYYLRFHFHISPISHQLMLIRLHFGISFWFDDLIIVVSKYKIYFVFANSQIWNHSRFLLKICWMSLGCYQAIFLSFCSIIELSVRFFQHYCYFLSFSLLFLPLP